MTNHLIKDHNISLEDYYILTELNGVDPKCKCGYCDERPTFYRGKFLKYSSGHNNFEWKEQQHIKKYGVISCLTCGKEITKYHRGLPNNYCSPKCKPNNWNKDKVNRTVKERYGVVKNNWSENHDIILEKIKQTNLDRYGFEFAQHNKDVKERQVKTILENYGVDHYSRTDKIIYFQK